MRYYVIIVLCVLLFSPILNDMGSDPMVFFQQSGGKL